MKKLIVNGPKTLSGTIRVSGAKNAAVALIPASLLCTDGDITLCNVPNISDTENLVEILNFLGAKVKTSSESLQINASNISNKEIPADLSVRLRASYYFMGALLARFKEVDMFFPGGCSIGKRPIDLHLKAFEKLGAKVKYEDGKISLRADKLVGANISLDIASVGATINTILAASLAEGVTTIRNAAKEPEVVNLATMINNMGGKVTGAGTSTIKIVGVDSLHSSFTEIIPDRIEAATYVIMGALIGNNLKITNIIPSHIESILSKLEEMGYKIEVGYDYALISKIDNPLPTKIETAMYPGFPTDVQQIFTIILMMADGISTVEEKIFENRFMEVPYLNKMGGNIKVEGDTIIINGGHKLKGTEVVATDLRGGAALLLAGLAAEGVTTIDNAEHILRGYEGLEDKLNEVGADIKFID